MLQERGVTTVIVTANADSPLVALARKSVHRTCIVAAASRPPDGGYIPIVSTLTLALLLLKCPLLDKTRIEGGEALFETALTDHHHATRGAVKPSLGVNCNVITSALGAAAATDFETRMAEAGVGSTAVTDPWNFRHGRYMPFVINPHGQLLITFSVCDEDLAFLDIVDSLARTTTLFRVSAPLPGFWGSLYCIVRSMLLVNFITDSVGIDPAIPTVPEWATSLYSAGGRLG